MFGPQVQVYTSVHPLSPEERNGLEGEESSKPVKIGDDCWMYVSTIFGPNLWLF